MSMNLGFNGYNPAMSGGMQAIQAREGSVLSSLRAKYGCEDCFRKTPQPPAYTMPVLPVPMEVVKPGFWTRIRMSLLGN